MNPLHFVITGASRGIGFELTCQALNAGHDVSAIARDPDKAEQLQGLLQKFPKKLRIFKADVTVDEDIHAVGEELSRAHAVDVLINNAGAFLGGYEAGDDLERIELRKIAESFEINSIAPIRVTRALLPSLKKAKNPKIINITSLMGSISDNTGGGAYGYRMSKAALNMFNKSLSVDHPEIISVVVHPGWVKTRMGGDEAPTEAAESVAGIHELISKLTTASSGRFFDYEGSELPW